MYRGGRRLAALAGPSPSPTRVEVHSRAACAEGKTREGKSSELMDARNGAALTSAPESRDTPVNARMGGASPPRSGTRLTQRGAGSARGNLSPRRAASPSPQIAGCPWSERIRVLMIHPGERAEPGRCECTWRAITTRNHWCSQYDPDVRPLECACAVPAAANHRRCKEIHWMTGDEVATVRPPREACHRPSR